MREIGLDLDAFDLNKARAAIADERAGNRTGLRVGRHRDAHERLVVAHAVMHGFGDFDPVVAGEDRRCRDPELDRAIDRRGEFVDGSDAVIGIDE